MAKSTSLSSDDLMIKSLNTSGASPQRGATEKLTPSAELVPIQFRMPPDFVRAFKQEALNRDEKLNEFLKTCFHAFLNAEK